MSEFSEKPISGAASGAAGALTPLTRPKEPSLSLLTGGNQLHGATTAKGNAAALDAVAGGAATAAAGVLGHWAESGAASARMAAHAPPLSPREKFQQQYDEKKNRQLTAEEQNRARWRELSPSEVLAMAGAGVGQDPNAVTPNAGEMGYTTTVNGHTFRYDRVQEDPNKPTRISDLMGRPASQFNSRAFVTDRPKKDPADTKEHAYQDVTVLNADGTTSTLNQNDHGMVELPSSGFGFSTYNRNDVQIKDTEQRQKDQWGDPSSIANFINIANDYHTLRPDQTIEYGDVATDDNKSPLLYNNNPNVRHGSHGQGNQVDLRYPSDDFGTNALIRSAEDWGVNNFYYNPAKSGKYFFSDKSTNTPDADHDDHLHMGFGRGGRD